jgi:hypothetical protein
MRMFKSNDACRLAGLPPGTLKDHRSRQLMFIPAVQGGHGRPSLWTVAQCFGLCLMTHLRRRGCSLRAAIATYHFIAALSDEQLVSQFADGRRFLVIMGDLCVPRLIHFSTIDSGPDFSANAALMKGIPVCLVDVEDAHAQFKLAVESMASPKAAPETVS